MFPKKHRIRVITALFIVVVLFSGCATFSPAPSFPASPRDEGFARVDVPDEATAGLASLIWWAAWMAADLVASCSGATSGLRVTSGH